MADEGRILFDWREVAAVETLANRYQPGVRGYDRWLEIAEPAPGSERWLTMAMELFHSGLAEDPDRSRGRVVFISHRQADHKLALRAARHLNYRGFDTWLDIEDPDLRAIPAMRGVPDAVKLLLTALIIEMALLNSTHVLALFTVNTPGSMWVPYEYGRVKLPRVLSYQAASLSIGVPMRPEYMLLGERLFKFSDLDRWPA